MIRVEIKGDDATVWDDARAVCSFSRGPDGPHWRTMAEGVAVALGAHVPLYVRLARDLDSYSRCLAAPHDTGWGDRWLDTLEATARQYLPSGSGVDSGTTLDMERSKPDRIVLHTSFHHMDEHGFYAGWTEHSVILTPCMVHGFNLRVTGRDRNEIKGYLGEMFDDVLRQSVPAYGEAT